MAKNKTKAQLEQELAGIAEQLKAAHALVTKKDKTIELNKKNIAALKQEVSTLKAQPAEPTGEPIATIGYVDTYPSALPTIEYRLTTTDVPVEVAELSTTDGVLENGRELVEAIPSSQEITEAAQADDINIPPAGLCFYEEATSISPYFLENLRLYFNKVKHVFGNKTYTLYMFLFFMFLATTTAFTAYGMVTLAMPLLKGAATAVLLGLDILVLGINVYVFGYISNIWK